VWGNVRLDGVVRSLGIERELESAWPGRRASPPVESRYPFSVLGNMSTVIGAVIITRHGDREGFYVSPAVGA
jgi:hypothetical protein